MSRLLIAFVLALFFHLLLGMLPWCEKKQTLPQLAGDKAITINLTPANPIPVRQNQKVKISSQNPPATESEPVPKDRETSISRILKPRAKKIAHAAKILPSPPASSLSPVAEKLPNTSIKSTPTAPKIPHASPVIIKAVPLYAQNPKPPYPSLALRRSWQGVVILAVTVSKDGTPTQLAIETSSGHDLLDDTALKSVQQWHFLPGKINNIPTSMEVLVPVHFMLQ